jgi:LacI family transcriptional regulator
VTDDQHGILRMAMKRILAAGYRRIGFILPKAWDDLVDQAWSSGFLMEQNQLPGVHRIPILFHDATETSEPGREQQATAAEAEKLTTWLDEYRPEVILSSWGLVGGLLSELGITVGREVGFVDLFLTSSDRHRRFAGVCQNSDRVGEVATEMLVNLMQQHICGAPAVPTATLVEGVWCDGESLPSLEPQEGWRGEPLPLVEAERCEPAA